VQSGTTCNRHHQGGRQDPTVQPLAAASRRGVGARSNRAHDKGAGIAAGWSGAPLSRATKDSGSVWPCGRREERRTGTDKIEGEKTRANEM
jgi:hypothetical protein